MKLKRVYIGICCICFIIGGIGLTMIGSLLPDIITEYNISYKAAGVILSLQSFGVMLAGFVSGFFADKFGKKMTLICGIFLFGLGISSLLFASRLLTLQIFCATAGAGYGVINNMGNALVNDISNRNNVAINFLHACYAFGCFIIPLLVQLSIVLQVSWKFPVKIFAVLAGLLLIVILFMPLGKSTEFKKKDSRTNFRFLKSPHYYIFLLALLLCTGFHNGIIGWMVTYLSDSGNVDAIGAQKIFSLLLLGLIIGRLMCAALCKWIRADTLLLFSSVIPVLALFAIIVTDNRALSLILYLVCGISYAGQYPLIVSNAKKVLYNNATASGILFSLSGLGAMFSTYICGFVAEIYGTKAILFVIILIGLLLIITSFANRRIIRNKCMYGFNNNNA